MRSFGPSQVFYLKVVRTHTSRGCHSLLSGGCQKCCPKGGHCIVLGLSDGCQ